jgi:putative FmdB family regulatory protein
MAELTLHPLNDIIEKAMPIYEYLCQDCGNRFEKLVRRPVPDHADVLEAGCPSCGRKHLQQEYSTFAARATDGSSASAPMGGGCPSGMCQTPGRCGRN